LGPKQDLSQAPGNVLNVLIQDISPLAAIHQQRNTSG
jgi:hypothetical protein